MRADIMEQAQNLKIQIDKNQRIADAVDAAGGITVTLEQSDKLGFDWRVYAVNRVIVRKEYVAQANPAGTADNPIAWTPDARLIPNGHYTYGGEVKVWMGDGGVTASWDDAGWEAV